MGGGTRCAGWAGKLARLRGELERWRRRRERGDRIPEELWREAVALASECGVSKAASLLSLDYYGLKRRLAEAAAGSRAEFVEVPLPGILGGAGECVVEIEEGDRRRLRVELKGAATAAVEDVARALWGIGR